MTDEARQRLHNLKEELERTEPWPWSNIEAWCAKATPLIRRIWPDDLDDFREAGTEPQWVMSLSSDAPNRTRAEQAKSRIRAFLEGLLAATEPQLPPAPVILATDNPGDIRQQILQTLLDAQGNSANYVPAAAIAERLSLKPDEVEGHLEILREEGKVQLDWNSSGCFGHLTDGQKQRFRESCMAIDGNEVRQRILQTIWEVQGDSNRYTNDSQIAEKLGLTVSEVDGHLAILQDERKLQYTRSSGGCSAYLTDGQKQRFKESLAAPRSAAPSVVRSFPVEITESLKQFLNDHPDPSKVAFVMMRFGTTPAHNNIVESIRSTLQPLGITALRADEKQYHPDLWYNILTYLVGCGFGIAVFERIEQEEFNPNVALEVGYLYGVGKPVCLLKDKTLKILHADIIGRLYCQFDPLDPRGTIPPPLRKWLSDTGLA